MFQKEENQKDQGTILQSNVYLFKIAIFLFGILLLVIWVMVRFSPLKKSMRKTPPFCHPILHVSKVLLTTPLHSFLNFNSFSSRHIRFVKVEFFIYDTLLFIGSLFFFFAFFIFLCSFHYHTSVFVVMLPAHFLELLP